jgi:ATP-dependent DNA helicase Q4
LKILLEKKQNALVVLATGGGKSLVYLYASMFQPGLILVITPLISLMTDQLNKLPEFIPGAAINSQQPPATKKAVLQAITEKKIKVLFISPERFFIEDFNKYNREIAMVCVDEIHCASEWSHNFRPTYLKINDMIREKLGVTNTNEAINKQKSKKSPAVVLGLTATATVGTQLSICKSFTIKYPEHIITLPDLSRMNLQLSITRDTEKQKALLMLLRSESFKKLDSILIFATHKRTCDQMASVLTQNGMNAASYHAGKTD